MGADAGNLARTEGRQRAVAVARALSKLPERDQIQDLVRMMVRRTPDRVNLVQSILGRHAG